MINLEWILVYFLIGSLVGFMGGLLGVGGGGMLVPLLTSIFLYQGIPTENVIHLALGTSLASMIFSSLSSIRAHWFRGTIALKITCCMAPGVLVGTFVVTRLAAQINSAYIAVFFALFMMFIATQMFLNWQPKSSQIPSTFSSLFFAGAIIGSVSSLAAVGGGILAVMYLNYKNIEMKKAVGTSAALGFLIALAGTIGYLVNGWSITSEISYTFGFIYMPAFLLISIASVFTAPYGVRCSHKLTETSLKRIFAVLCILLSAKMLFQILNSP